MSATHHTTTQPPTIDLEAITYAVDASGIDDRARAALIVAALDVPGIEVVQGIKQVDVLACAERVELDHSTWTLDAHAGQPRVSPVAHLHVEWLGALTAPLPTPGAITAFELPEIPAPGGDVLAQDELDDEKSAPIAWGLLEILAPDGNLLAQHKLNDEMCAGIAWGLQLRAEVVDIYSDGVVPESLHEVHKALGLVWDATTETLDELRHLLAQQRVTLRTKLVRRLRGADLRGIDLDDVMDSVRTHMSLLADANADRDARRVLITELALNRVGLITLLQLTGEIQA